MSDWHSARAIVARLKGRWGGSSGTCRCPAHDDKSPSLSVTQTRDGRVLVHCHANCSQKDVIEALMHLGLWPEGPVTVDPSYPGRLTTLHDGHRDKDERNARADALSIWDNAKSAQGTVVADYLKARGIRLPVSEQLRFAPRLVHWPTKLSFRAMIARVSDHRGFCAIQRTFLNLNEPKKADILPNKMSRGPLRGGAVRLRVAEGEHLGLAEGVETALSAIQLYAIPVWASLSANRLSRIEIPSTVRALTIFGDSGEVGRAQAFLAADEYERKGLRTDVIFPAAHYSAELSDFNDALRASA